MRWPIPYLRRIALSLGVDVRRRRYGVQYSEADRRRALLLEEQEVTAVLDVGANTGQYARALRASGYEKRIISFEPIVSAYKRLALAAADDARWRCEQLAIGCANCTRTINVAANGAESSSFLPMRIEHTLAAPQATYVGVEAVRQVRLDDVASGLVEAHDRVHLKADVQGCELEVLRSAIGLFEQSTVVTVEVELSLIPLYEGGPLIEDVIMWLRDRGFMPVGFEEVFANPRTGVTLQVAGLFSRGDAPRLTLAAST